MPAPLGRSRSTYRELPPPPPLAPYIACLWMHAVDDAGPDYHQPVLPDGCMDLISTDGEVIVAGPATRPVTVRVAAGSVTVAVRFRPGAAPPVLGVSAAELRDQDTAIDDVWGRAGSIVAARAAEATD
ncbi:MAG: DUF6597 domain-containing transcriptional factor, partial [Acidimicrobiales bacterium]